MSELTDIYHPLKACILLTRKCNLQCSYCGVIHNEPVGPPLDTLEKWMKVFDATRKFEVGVHILFGGEPMMFPEIKLVVNYLNNENLPYAFITNSTFPIRQYRELNLRQLSCSVDLFEGCNHQEHNELKSSKGLRLLMEMKEVPDRLANIGLSSKNLDVIPKAIPYLSENNIWVITTPLHDGNGYESFPWRYRINASHPDRIKPEDQGRLEKFCEQMVNLKRQGYLIHQFEEFFSSFLPTFGINLDWHCAIPAHFTIDSDGSVMNCIDYRGYLTSQFKVWDLLDIKKLQEFMQTFREEIRQCPGCCWDHIIESETMYLANPEQGKRNFQHRGKP